MRDEFIKFQLIGTAMTKEDLARILNVKPAWVQRHAKAGLIPRIPHMRLLRFDPSKMMEVFCDGRSLTIKEPSSASSHRKGVLRACL